MIMLEQGETTAQMVKSLGIKMIQNLMIIRFHI